MHISAHLFLPTILPWLVTYSYNKGYGPLHVLPVGSIDPITTRDGPSQHLRQPSLPPFSQSWIPIGRLHDLP